MCGGATTSHKWIKSVSSALHIRAGRYVSAAHSEPLHMLLTSYPCALMVEAVHNVPNTFRWRRPHVMPDCRPHLRGCGQPCIKAAPAPSLQGRSQARHSGHEHQGDVDNDVKMRRHRFGAVTGPPEAANETEEACFTRMPRCTPEKMCCLGLCPPQK